MIIGAAGISVIKAYKDQKVQQVRGWKTFLSRLLPSASVDHNQSEGAARGRITVTR